MVLPTPNHTAVGMGPGNTGGALHQLRIVPPAFEPARGSGASKVAGESLATRERPVGSGAECREQQAFLLWRHMLIKIAIFLNIVA